MSTASRVTRTYSKKHATRYTSSSKIASSSKITPEQSPSKHSPLKRGVDSRSSDEDDSSQGHLSWLQKRRKVTRKSERLPTLPSSPVETDTETKLSKSRGRRVLPLLSNKATGLPTSSTLDDAQHSLPATPKRPKDLSAIFDFLSPSANSQLSPRSSNRSPSTPGKARKMLSQSRTESSIDDSPSRKNESLRKTQSFAVSSTTTSSTSHKSQISPLKRNASQMSESGSHSQSESQSEIRRAMSVKVGKTYAGASRSFLVSIPTTSIASQLGEEGILGGSQNEDDFGSYRASYTELRKRYGIDNSEDNPHSNGENDGRVDEGLSLYNPLSSITDLRSKGESRRFTDEVGYLLEGLDPSSDLSVRRGSALDIVVKLCDQSFWRKARAAGLLTRVWELMRGAGAGDGDKVLDFILSCFVALASEEARDITSLASQDDFVETILRMLEVHSAKDPIYSDSVKLTKLERMTLNRASESISRKENLIPEGCSVSTRLLLSSSFATEPSLANHYVPQVLNSMSSDVSEIRKRLESFSSGLSLNLGDFEMKPESRCLGHIRNCLVVLDAYLLQCRAEGSDRSSAGDIRGSHPWLASGLVALITLADCLVRVGVTEALAARLNECTDLAFRVLINLTDESPEWCEAIASDPYALPIISRIANVSQVTVLAQSAKKVVLDADAEDNTKAMDRLCLSLALLTNLLQELSTMASMMQGIMFSASCRMEAPCLRGCRCDSADTCVNALSNMYISLLKIEEDESTPDLHFVRGHLAVIIGLLLLQLKSTDADDESDSDDTSFHDILISLPGTSSRRKLDALIKNIKSFSQLYSSMAQSIAKGGEDEEGEGGDGANVDDDGDGQDLEGLIRSRDKTKNELDFVLDVIGSLQSLRNEL